MSVRYRRRPGGAREAAGVLRHWSSIGARLETREPLELGDWLEVRLPPQAPRELVGPRNRRAARVVWASEDEPAGLHAYGVEFGSGWRLALARLAHALLPLLAVVLFAAGVSHVFVLKAANVHYFWYRPAANVYSLLISFYILSRFALSAFYRPPRATG